MKLLNDDGQGRSRREICHTSNKYFCSTWKALEMEADDAPKALSSHEYQLNTRNFSFEFISTKLRDFIEAIVKIKASKRSGVNIISGCFFNLTLPYIEKSLALMLSISLEIGNFLDIRLPRRQKG